jgi:hypothetical protein
VAVNSECVVSSVIFAQAVNEQSKWHGVEAIYQQTSRDCVYMIIANKRENRHSKSYLSKYTAMNLEERCEIKVGTFI